MPFDDRAEVAPEDAPFFNAVLTPHRSLGPRGFLVVMGAICAVSFTVGILFWAIGAWPIFGFCGLDVLLVWLAFRANYRAARAREEIAVSTAEIRIRRVSPKGRAEEVRLNPVWARLVVERTEDEGVTRLALASHGRAVEIGHFLAPVERESFAAAFGDALATARAGGPA
ncbi:DUF2244 domain-containing protein [Segnochrobactrum spirostomi]|uniref:DUF2244 domain-containing protein n=1 Tax=Segnochrobactrum spirostomi TaxID=2608987 RepID=A0A6A7Y1W7_9HYPH|nr:DUF2244 domain-containing protein [Segnochrobactrum spirostomi]MQT13024.1 DUF2244 domain-containing protein [Segnochrobactrum spirostomi]